MLVLLPVIIMVRLALVLYLIALLQQVVVMVAEGQTLAAPVALAEAEVGLIVVALGIHHPQLHHKVIPAAQVRTTTLVVAVVLVVAVEMPLHRLGELAVLALTRVRPLEHLMV